MADQFSKMYDFERVGGDQRTRLAEMLRSNAMNTPQGQTVSGWYVPPSWSQNLAHMANTAVGVMGGAALDEEKKAKTAELLRQLSEGKEEQVPMQNIPGVGQGAGMAEGQSRPDGEVQQTPIQQQPQMRRVPLSEDEKIGKVMELAQYNPYAAQIWSAQDAARQNRLTRAEERAMDREFKREQLQEQLQGRRDMMQLAASLRPPAQEPLVAVMGKDGNPIMLPRGQAIGMTPFNAQTSGTGAGTPAARQREAGEAIDIVLQAAPLVRQSTASGIGAGVDWLASGVGYSPKGADVAAQLKVLGGALVSKMPKMSGPQSDKDVMLYKEMAGRIGDPTVPTSQKEAALQTVYDLNAKYSGAPEQKLNFSPDSVMQGYMPNVSAIDAEIARRQGR